MSSAKRETNLIDLLAHTLRADKDVRPLCRGSNLQARNLYIALGDNPTYNCLYSISFLPHTPYTIPTRQSDKYIKTSMATLETHLKKLTIKAGSRSRTGYN